MERKCELCPARAALYCAADEAYICWECDAIVHGANFLVARHCRSLLCRRCSSPTLWRASGARFHATTRLCSPCESGNDAATESGRISNKNQSDSANLLSTISASESVRRNFSGERPEYGATLCSSFCRSTGIVASSSKSSESNKIVHNSFKVRRAPQNRPHSPVSVIPPGRKLVKKRRILVQEQSFCESSSNSDSEDFSDTTDPEESEDLTQISEFALTWTESSFFQTISRRRRNLAMLQNSTLDQERRNSNSHRTHLRVFDIRQLFGRAADEIIERMFLHWHNQLNLRSPATVTLAMHLLCRFFRAIKASDVDGLDFRILLAGCTWIAIKLNNPQSAESRSQLYEQCTGYTLRILLAAEEHICYLLNWRFDLESCTDGVPRRAMDDR